jgi:hypothetical protein
MTNRTATIVYQLLVSFALAFAIVITLRAIAFGETPDEWFQIAVQIQAQQHQLDAEERRFVANVVNRLAVSQDAVPTPAHKEWLLNLKRRLRIQ